MSAEHPKSGEGVPEGWKLPTDKHGETAFDRLTDHAENGTMPPQFREDLRAVLHLAASPHPDTAGEDAVGMINRLRDVYGNLTPGAIERADLDGMAFTVADAIKMLAASTNTAGAAKPDDAVERARIALEAQMENQDEHLPSSLARERGLVWLDGWFDLRAALTNSPEPTGDVWNLAANVKAPTDRSVLVRLREGIGEVYDVAMYVGKQPDGEDRWILADVQLETKQITHWREMPEGPQLEQPK